MIINCSNISNNFILQCKNIDLLTKNGYYIQLKLETTNVETLELGKLKILTRLPYGSERIRITCTKINCNENGILSACINGLKVNKSEPCLLYASNEQNNEFKCLSQTFEYTLSTQHEISSYEIECRLLQSNDDNLADSISFNLQRLCMKIF